MFRPLPYATNLADGLEFVKSKLLRLVISPSRVATHIGMLHPNSGISGLRDCCAGSPHHADRIEFKFLPHSGDFLRSRRAGRHVPVPRRGTGATCVATRG
jgi:hypothetical protein